MTQPRERLKVSATTSPQKTAGAIAKFILVDKKEIEISAIGAGAISQATKAMILARRFTASAGLNLSFMPAFESLEIGGREVTGVKWIPVGA